jgi:hypothetical protein
LQRGEHDAATKFDVKQARKEVQRLLDALEAGEDMNDGPAIEWAEADATNLFHRLGRTEDETLMDLVNLRVLQVLGVAGLFDYRPGGEIGAPPDPGAGTGGGDGGGDGAGEGTGPSPTGGRERREHQIFGEAYDVRLDLRERPYFTLEDLPAWNPQAVPRDDD